jgi:hypothetical protein
LTQRTSFDPGILKHYRGCAGLDSPRIQALERAVLARVGWQLLSEKRYGVEGPDELVRLYVNGTRRQVWSGQVTTNRMLAMPPCGIASGPAKQTSELAVSDVRLIDTR